MKARASAFALLLLAGACGEREATDASRAPDTDDAAFAKLSQLSEQERRPERFEPFLREHPADETRREAALIWYRDPDRDVDRLKHHTRKMIEYHPANVRIYFSNVSVFYRDPDYRLAVIGLLEDQLKNGHTGHGVYWILALTCKQAAVAPIGQDPEDRERFLRYYQLPRDTALPRETDSKLAEKAVRYFKAAIRAAGKDKWHVVFYSEQLADLLVALDRFDEAVRICEAASPDPADPAPSSFFVTYGRCLRKLGRFREAKEILGKVRALDKWGFEGGPAGATTDAETELGLIAVEEGRLDQACEHLLASVDVQKCCQNITFGFPLTLARKLLEKGKHRAVAEYCRLVLTKFRPGQKETEALMRRADERGRPTTNASPAKH